MNGKKLGDSIIGKANKLQQQNGAEKLRTVVEWMNNRPEHLNENKNHIELIMEFNDEQIN